MITEYIEAALSKARYEIIEDEEPYYGEVPELEGVWATGKTLEECRKNLAEVIDGWIVVRLRKGLSNTFFLKKEPVLRKSLVLLVNTLSF
jgi:predicted RNase H-like HicB family nuclease